jgi:hypothetical protein
VSKDVRFSSYGPTLNSASLLRIPTRDSAALISREPIAVMRRPQDGDGSGLRLSLPIRLPFW